MAKGFTYFCTDKNGTVHNRYSARHPEAAYVTARIHYGKDGASPATKHGVSYSSKPQGPALASWEATNCQTEVVKVRAYEGRHKVEPAPQGWAVAGGPTDQA
jgi:hypothetical protein